MFFFRFKAQDPGTHFWHAHSGFQRTDGVFGSFIIRQTKFLDKHAILYDEDLPEHTIMLNDWLNKMGAASFVAGHHAMQKQLNFDKWFVYLQIFFFTIYFLVIPNKHKQSQSIFQKNKAILSFRIMPKLRSVPNKIIIRKNHR